VAPTNIPQNFCMGLLCNYNNTHDGRILVQGVPLYMQFWFDCITRLVGYFWGLGFTRLYIIWKSEQTPQLSRRTKLFMLSCFRDLSDKLVLSFPFGTKNALYLLSTYSTFLPMILTCLHLPSYLGRRRKESEEGL